jgi:HK97 family phage major capsid protein
MANATAQTSGFLLDPKVVTLDQSGDYSLRGKVFPAWDLTATKAVRVGEVTQTDPNSYTAPPSYAKFTNSYLYRVSLPIAIELLDDTNDEIISALTTAYGEAFARGIGADLINGTGSSQPQGLLVGATDSGIYSPLSFNFLCDLFWSVNRRHRAAAKAAWVMGDSTWETVRKLQDTVGRPLYSIQDGQEMLLGKPVYITPDIADNPNNSSPAVQAKIIFGDLGHFLVRCSRMTVTKTTESGLANGLGDITKGECLLSGRMRVDSVVHDPSSGSVPPIKYASFNGVQLSPGSSVTFTD